MTNTANHLSVNHTWNPVRILYSSAKTIKESYFLDPKRVAKPDARKLPKILRFLILRFSKDGDLLECSECTTILIVIHNKCHQ